MSACYPHKAFRTRPPKEKPAHHVFFFAHTPQKAIPSQKTT
jgi:hypothetical protein